MSDGYFFNSCISSSIWFELFSKNLMWKSFSFSFGIGLSILGGSSDVIIGALAISVFGGFVVIWVSDQS